MRQALRALALIRLGRQDETTATLQEVHALHPNDEHTLQAMAMCYRDVNRRTLRYLFILCNYCILTADAWDKAMSGVC